MIDVFADVAMWSGAGFSYRGQAKLFDTAHKLCAEDICCEREHHFVAISTAMRVCHKCNLLNAGLNNIQRFRGVGVQGVAVTESSNKLSADLEVVLLLNSLALL